jgi:hypothetical protein
MEIAITLDQSQVLQLSAMLLHPRASNVLRREVDSESVQYHAKLR